jgi:hypothetical protein
MTSCFGRRPRRARRVASMSSTVPRSGRGEASRRRRRLARERRGSEGGGVGSGGVLGSADSEGASVSVCEPRSAAAGVESVVGSDVGTWGAARRGPGRGCGVGLGGEPRRRTSLGCRSVRFGGGRVCGRRFGGGRVGLERGVLESGFLGLVRGVGRRHPGSLGRVSGGTWAGVRGVQHVDRGCQRPVDGVARRCNCGQPLTRPICGNPLCSNTCSSRMVAGHQPGTDAGHGQRGSHGSGGGGVDDKRTV